MAKTRLVILLLLVQLRPSLGVTREYHYVQLAKTWPEAQSYCRENFGDLATIATAEDWARVRKIMESADRLVWIGLHYTANSWRWSDQSTSSLRRFGSGEGIYGSIESCACTLVGHWADLRCSIKIPFICSVPLMKLLEVVLKVDGSVDPNDPAVQEAVLKHMEKQMKDHGTNEKFRLRWRKQTNGEIFNKK